MKGDDEGKARRRVGDIDRQREMAVADYLMECIDEHRTCRWCVGGLIRHDGVAM